MPLEFALRPRLALERTSPQRKRRRARLPALALPMLAYWLAIAGVTRALLRSVAEEPVDRESVAAATEPVADVDEATPSPPAEDPNTLAMTITSGVTAPPARDLEPAPLPAAAPETAPNLARGLDPSTKVENAAAPLVTATPRVQAFEPAPPLAVPRARRSELEEAPVSREPARDDGRKVSLPSCESAAASANQTVDLRASPGAPDLTRDAFASVLENGSYLGRCSLPARTALEICAAVQDGKVVGVSVTSTPHSSSIDACVRRAVAALHFPVSARLDVTRTRFEGAH